MKNPLRMLLLTTLILSGTLGVSAEAAPPYARWTDSELLLNNGVVQRTIKLPAQEGNFLTTVYKPVVGDFKYFLKTNPDFQFEVNGKVYTGSGDWRLITIGKITDAKQGDGAAVTLQSKDGMVELTVKFLLYPDLPVIRKNLIVKNLTNQAVPLASVDVEKFTVPPFHPTTYSWIASDYGRRRVIGPFEGSMQDAMVIVHHMDWQQGIVIGNEATGVVKRTSVFWEGPEICAGLTHKNGRFPFRKWIKPGESFETPQVFTMVYNTHKDPDEILNTAVPTFNMAWWRSPAIPATALVIGNPEMQDKGWEMHIKSLAGALPIMLGDPRKLSEIDLKRYRNYADWLQAMQTKHDFMSYRQDLFGFGEPMEGMWDGFQRINTDTEKGGIMGIFRHGAKEQKRMITVQHLDPLKQYQVKSMQGKVLSYLTEQALQTTGFAVNLTNPYSGELFEISVAR